MSYCEENAARQTGEEQHCLHDRPKGNDRVCCWCGDLFYDDTKGTQHGKFLPRHARVKKNASRQKSSARSRSSKR